MQIMYTEKILCSLQFFLFLTGVRSAQNVPYFKELKSNHGENVTYSNPFRFISDPKTTLDEQETTTPNLIEHISTDNIVGQEATFYNEPQFKSNLYSTTTDQPREVLATTSTENGAGTTQSFSLTESIQDVKYFEETSTVRSVTRLEHELAEETHNKSIHSQPTTVEWAVEISTDPTTTDQISYIKENSHAITHSADNLNTEETTASHDDSTSTTTLPEAANSAHFTYRQTETSVFTTESYTYKNDTSNEVKTTPKAENILSELPPKIGTSEIVVVRKCCPTLQYFNSLSFTCTPFDSIANTFDNDVLNILNNKSNTVTFASAALQCENGLPPVTHFGVVNSSHAIVDNGQILDISLNTIYDRTEYCLELVGESPSQISFTLAYCQRINDYDYYHHDYDYAPAVDAVSNDIITENAIIVRKCCQNNEYYDTQSHRCAPTYASVSELFLTLVKGLAFENNVANVNIISARLKSCPHDNTPRTNVIDDHSYRLRYNGDVVEMSTGQLYNHSFYCIEQVGPDISRLQLTIARCDMANYILPKCCPADYYFDEDKLDCEKLSILDGTKILLDNYQLDNSTYALEPLESLDSLTCEKSFPSKALSRFISFVNGKLCLKELCYNKHEFCIDFIGSENLYKLQAMAYYCRYSFFVKCCELGEVLGEKGCTKNSDENSILLKEFLRTKSMVRSFNYNECKEGRTTLLEDGFTKHIQWWLEDSYIVAKSDSEVREISHYCLDDLKYDNGRLQPVAYVCESDLENLIPIQKAPDTFKRPGSLAKCCAPKSADVTTIYAYSSSYGYCQTVPRNDSDPLTEHFLGANVTTEHYHDLPQCADTPAKYHVYPASSAVTGNEDYADLTESGDLQIVSMRGRCDHRQTLTDVDFCFEYILLPDGSLQASAIVCANDPVERIHNERFHLVAALLSISCICLFLTLISLFTTRVRRGIVSVQKVKTVAGRILVSFVGSHFIGFLALAITQYENSLNKEGSNGCYALAGFIQFFSLATFCWNTSICLESLLLTIRIRISECTRYLLHSLWAWGVPAMLTMLMFLMDAYKDTLPCGTIIPNIGVHHCFIFETEAKLLYFYLPIFVTLIANIIFLVGAKTLRTNRLKRLEKGKPRSAEPSVNAEVGQNGKPPTHHSGMRIHQGQNSTADTVRLVMWTGGTWFLELVGFLSARYIFPPKEETWYYYLWYIPTSINALRGIGIFIIIAITPEVKQRGSQKISSFKQTIVERLQNLRATDGESRTSRRNGSGAKYSKRWSISTMISSIRNSSMRGIGKSGIATDLNGYDNHGRTDKDEISARTSRKMRIVQSPSVASSVEEYEMKDDTQRKWSSASSTLPNLQEENDITDSQGD